MPSNHPKTIADLSVGDVFRKAYVITDADVLAFAKLSDDFNPLHLSDDFAAKTMFGRRIAHGMLSLSKFSGIFGMEIPGLGTLWETQEVRFLKPIYLNEKYTAVAQISAISGRRAHFRTFVEDRAGVVCLDGTAVVIPPSRVTLSRLT